MADMVRDLYIYTYVCSVLSSFAIGSETHSAIQCTFQIAHVASSSRSVALDGRHGHMLDNIFKLPSAAFTVFVLPVENLKKATIQNIQK